MIWLCVPFYFFPQQDLLGNVRIHVSSYSHMLVNTTLVNWIPWWSGQVVETTLHVSLTTSHLMSDFLSAASARGGRSGIYIPDRFTIHTQRYVQHSKFQGQEMFPFWGYCCFGNLKYFAILVTLVSCGELFWYLGGSLVSLGKLLWYFVCILGFAWRVCNPMKETCVCDQ